VTIDPLVIAFGLGVGTLIGLTGIGGGSLMTPPLVIVVGVQPVAAIGTDLAYGAITKTVGVLGVSPDPPQKLRAFPDKYGPPFTPPCDDDHSVAEKFGVWLEMSIYRRSYVGTERSTLVIGPDGKIGHVFRPELRCWNFETGNYSQYDQHQWSEGPWADQSTYTINNVGHSSCEIVTSPVAQGTYASKCQVRPTTGTSSADRAEMYASAPNVTGDASQVQFYGWYTMFPSNNGQPQQWWPNGEEFNDFFQFGQVQGSGGDWVYCGVNGHNPDHRLYCKGPGVANGRIEWPLQYDHWYHFVVEARWSRDPSVGYLSIWVDGVNVSPKTYGATLTGTAAQVHVSLGMYRAAYSSTNTVIHDGFCRAATFDAASGC
jgi:Polysaccharide lyase/AhpC/TSA family